MIISDASTVVNTFQTYLLIFRSNYYTIRSNKKGGFHLLVCTLSVLMAERGLKISDVSKETGISRTTLTSLANNNCSGVQLDTMNTLCSFLNVQPSELFSFEPIDIYATRFSCVDDSICFNEHSVSYSEIVIFHFSHGWNNTESIASLVAEIEATYHSSENMLSVNLRFSAQNTENREDTDNFIALIEKLPRQFITVIEKDFSYGHSSVSVPIRNLIEHYPGKKPGSTLKLKYSILWPV